MRNAAEAAVPTEWRDTVILREEGRRLPAGFFTTDDSSLFTLVDSARKTQFEGVGK